MTHEQRLTLLLAFKQIDAEFAVQRDDLTLDQAEAVVSGMEDLITAIQQKDFNKGEQVAIQLLEFLALPNAPT